MAKFKSFAKFIATDPIAAYIWGIVTGVAFMTIVSSLIWTLSK